MADELTVSGLTTKSNTELLSDIQAGLQTIYGQNGELLNFDSNTPDGNFTEILAEIGTVVRELITEVYNSIDPSKCSGAVQDSRYQINYLTRKTGTFTRQNIDITVDRTVTLQGLDGAYADENASSYTVSDDAGNLWYLIDTTTLYAGTTSCPFRAKNMGEVIPTIGTITNQVTIVGGVLSVINDVGYTILGTEVESDNEFRVRRERSVALASGNSEDAMVGKILALEGVTGVNLHQNRTNTTDATGTEAHTIWVIVGGGANTEIAKIIYENLGGSGTRGQITVPVTSVSGQTININFDRPEIVPIYIKFNLLATVSAEQLNLNAIKEYVANNVIFEVGESAETSKIVEIATTAIQAQGNGGYAVGMKISTGGSATVDIGSSTGITGADINVVTFQARVDDVADTYTFSFDGTDWKLDGAVVDLDDYGILPVGTPANNDEIIVEYTASAWVDYIEADTIAQKFVPDASKIQITVV